MTGGGAVQVFGAGGHAAVVVATLVDAGFEVGAIWDDDVSRHGADCLGVRVEGPLENAPDLPTVIAVGDNRARARIAARHPRRWCTVVHPAAYVHGTARVGEGAVIFAGAIIQPRATIGAHAIINTAASVDHDGSVGAFAHIGPGVRLCGGVVIHEGALLGVGAVARPAAVVGAWATIGAGATVIQPVGPHEVAVGTPARPRSRSRP